MVDRRGRIVPSAGLAAGIVVAGWLAGMPASVMAGLGDCGQPKSTTAAPTAGDALEVLRTAVGQSFCGGLDFCVCDVDSSGSVVAGDALRVLKKAVGQAVVLDCSCNVTTTTTTSSSTLPAPLSTELMVLTRVQGAYATADMQGTWDGSALVTGPAAPLWTRLLLTIQSNGSFSGETTSSSGPSENISGKVALSAAGILTCTQNCAPTFHGAIDSGKTVGAITDTLDSTSTELYVVTRRGASYAQGDLAGTWSLASMVSGYHGPGWSRGSLVVQSGGSFTAETIDSDGITANWSGTLTLSGIGRVTCSSPGCASNFRGDLDSGKTVSVASQTRSDGSSDLVLMVKRAASYAQADLTGTWNFHSLVSGLDDPLWRKGTVSIAANGAASGTIQDSDGHSEGAAGTMTIDADGVVRVSGDPAMRCALDAGKSVLVCTDTR